jgi:ubiquinone/menaquinone biosynthesis C-methylase UbiE
MSKQQDYQTKLFEIYKNHPISYQTIMARINNASIASRNLCEDDFAVDKETEITDQNHIGGKEASLELIQQLSITESDSVLDIGSGLGGTARLLVEMTGCKVDGIDIFPGRVQDARKLTDMLGMTDKINYFQGDFLSLELSDNRYDYIICQSAFVHFIDKELFFKRCRSYMKPNAVLVIEDSFIAIRNDTYKSDIENLEDIWLSKLISIAELEKVCHSNGMYVAKQHDMNNEFSLHFESLLATFDIDAHIANEAEKLSWMLALKLRKEKIINYLRLFIKLK